VSLPDLQPTLEGTLVTLRPLRPQDWQPMFAVASDPLIWELHPEPTRYQEAVFRRFFDSGLEAGSALAILAGDSGRIIGSSRYYGHDPQWLEIEIGWTFLERAYWGGRYNREVKRLMLQHAFGFVDTVVFWVGEHNLRSRRAMQKIGGVLRAGVHERWSTRQVIYEIRKGHAVV
jgi:RimJ/RimL family protein N-acetyltransferase